jgi:beta-N-acetylhexosaminidase
MRSAYYNRMTYSWWRLVLVLIVLSGFIYPLTGSISVSGQDDLTPQEKAQQLLNTMSPEERVGQLFLATFTGMDVGEESQIFDLIVNHHIGGVILLAGNDNFQGGNDMLAQIVAMSSQLQLNRWTAAQEPQVDPAAGETTPVHYVPLFIGTIQEGDGYSYDQILSGLTRLPSAMALGATWQPEMAAQVGEVLGKELAALGINLLIGPSLDVLETPKPESSSDLGIHSFGGDPFWVGEMGKAYIRGVHKGSRGVIATVAQHFPGNGGADRPVEEEVSTVRKSFDQLKRIDLVPFFAVTGNAPSQEETTDALLASHIRYQGFQENIRATTRPVSFDPQAFTQLMQLPALADWRQDGGVMISDNLGSRAVRSFYELTGQVYDARRVALNAFLAGNDLLYLGDISTDENPDSYSEVLNIIQFFNQKYREDPAFAQRVDESAARVLAMKFRQYPDFSLTAIVPPAEGVDALGRDDPVSYDVVSKAATLISPTIEDLDITIPDPPNKSDRIVFFTEELTGKQCTQCPEEVMLAEDALQQAVIRLYGPQAGSQVMPFNLTSYSFQELQAMLDAPRSTTQLEIDLRRAQWIVFSMISQDPGDPIAQALPRFLAERPDLFQQKRLIVFALNAPYFLDATNISKLTAYYGIYTKITSALDSAARLLFRELTPTGVLPVSVPGVGYDLITATSPEPNQVISLSIDQNGDTQAETTGTPAPIPTPAYNVGSTIPVQTGVILDHNGHPVPDNTPVQFIISVDGVVNTSPQVETTVGGVGRVNIQVTTPGIIEVRAESEPAKQSEILRFDIPPENMPEPTATATSEPTATTQPTPTVTLPPPVVPTAPIEETDPLSLVDWFVAMLLAVIISSSAYRLSAWAGQVRWGVRSGFFALIGGLIAYCYLALALPGSEDMLLPLGGWGVLLVTTLGCVLGLLATWIWRSVRLSTGREH